VISWTKNTLKLQGNATSICVHLCPTNTQHKPCSTAHFALQIHNTHLALQIHNCAPCSTNTQYTPCSTNTQYTPCSTNTQPTPCSTNTQPTPCSTNTQHTPCSTAHLALQIHNCAPCSTNTQHLRTLLLSIHTYAYRVVKMHRLRFSFFFELLPKSHI